MLREIVTIDEELCDGCGQCVPSCEEGALRIVNGKARLVSDRLCDGLGACLGHCPQGAIRIEQRESDAFDEQAVAAHLGQTPAAPTPQPPAGGCPGSRLAQFKPEATPAGAESGKSGQPSALSHWPVQLRLLPPSAPLLRGARLLIAADCVPVAYADFHAELLRDRAVVIACPKLDDPDGYVEKLAEMIRQNDLAELTVAHMEVPCCTGILAMVLEARRRAKSALAINDIVISVHGQVLARRQIPAESRDSCNTETACCHRTTTKGVS